MSSVLVSNPEYERHCDVCQKKKDHFISKEVVSVGTVQSQGESYTKTMTFDVSGSIPYGRVEDICIDCAESAFLKVINKIRSQ